MRLRISRLRGVLFVLLDMNLELRDSALLLVMRVLALADRLLEQMLRLVELNVQ